MNAYRNSAALFLPLYISICTAEEQAYNPEALQEEIRWLKAETYVTTATRTHERINKTGASISVITAEDLQRMGARSLFDALKRVPGLGISQFNLGMSSLEVRGIKTDFAEKVLFLRNGHPINNNLVNGGANSSFNEFIIDDIKLVEIVRGPGSALYGTNAFIAVVNIITKDGEDINGTTVNVGGGSQTTRKLNIQSGKQHEEHAYSVNVHAFDSHGDKGFVASDAIGQSGNAQYHQRRYEFGLKNRFKNLTIEAHYLKRESGHYLGVNNVLNDDTRQEYIDYYLTANWQHALNSRTHLTVDLYFDHFQFDNLWEVLPENFDSSTPDGLLLRSPIEHNKIGSDIRAEYQLSNEHKLLAGIQAEYLRQFNVELWSNGGAGPMQDLSGVANWNGEHNRKIMATYVQDIWDINHQLRMIAGVRLDHYSDFGSSFNPRISTVWDASPDFQIFASYGEAFRAPTFGELYNINNPAIVGNPNVKPEEITAVELGIRGTIQRHHRFTITGFQNNIDELIGSTPTSTAVNTSGNIGKLRVQGAEIEILSRLSNGSELSLNYTYQYPVNRLTGTRAPDVPLHKANLGYNHYFSKQVNLFTGLMYKGESIRANSDNRADVEEYVTVDMALTTHDLFIPQLDLTASAYNLLDKTYYDPSPAGVMLSDYPKPGRSLMIEARYTF